MNWLIWPAIGTLGASAIGALLWFLGYSKNQSKLQDANRETEREKERADAKATEAEIFARPRDSKPTVIGRL